MALTPEQEAQLLAHLNNNSNPHTTTSSQVGLQSTDDLPEGHINLYGDTPDNVKYSATDVSSAGWVVDEDNMSSDSNKKVPTQQSVKKYIEDTSMAQADYLTSVGRIMNPLLHLPLKNGFNMPHGKGSVTFTRASSATYIDRYGVVRKVGSDEPRFEKEGLLIEGSGTNLLTYSEDFSNSVWHNWQCTISANATTAPDGTNTADGHIRGSYNSSVSYHDTISSSATKVSMSCFWRPGNKNFFHLHLHCHTDTSETLYCRYIFDINDVAQEYMGIDPELTTTFHSKSLADGWHRVTVTLEYTGTNGVTGWYFSCGPAESFETIYFDGDGSTINTYVWGAQLEEFPHSTSYIPTTSASATRARDRCYVQHEGNRPAGNQNVSILMDWKPVGQNPVSNYLWRGTGAVLDLCCYYQTEYNYNRFTMSWGGNWHYYTTPFPNVKSRYGYVLSGASKSFYIDGQLKATANRGDFSSIRMDQGIHIGENGERTFGHYSNFRIYDVALTKEEMKIA